MELLSFAHRGEAKSFLKQGRFSPIPFAFDGLYQNDHSFLLIHGEGIQATTEKLSMVCGAFREKIHVIINLGICGSLKRNDYKIGEIYPIRTCYREEEFKSFSTQNKKGIDLISSKDRVLDPGLAKNLSFFAPLVDREAWAVGSICHLLNLPFFSFKLVSDYSDNEEICRVVSDKSEEISKSLFEYYSKLELGELKKSKNLETSLYGTASQKRLFNSLSKKITLKNKKVNLLENDYNNLTPKKKMSKILEQMERDLSPFETKLREKLEILTEGLRESKTEIKFAKDFEDSTFSLTSKIKTQEDLDKLIKGLSAFPYKETKDLLEGRMDV